MTDLKTPDEHSKMIGGSSAKRVMHCPGSWALGKTQPEKPSSDYADEGTMLHNAIAMILAGDVQEPQDIIGLTYGDHEVTEELYVELIEPALDLFRSLDLDDFVIETRVGFPDLPGEFGTCDIIGIHAGYTVVLDWKFGRGVYVNPIDNEQLRYYGAAARHSMPHWFTNDRPVRLYIVQPAFQSNKSYDEVELKDLVAFEKQLKQTTRMMKKPGAPFKEGDWCKWCPAMDVCPLINKMATTALKKDGELAPKELGRWLKEDAPRLEELIKSRRELARSQLDAGHPVPGMKLVSGRQGDRTWVDPKFIEDEIRILVRAKRAFLVSDFYKQTLLGPAGFEKVLKKKHATLAVFGPEDEIIERKPGKINMVPDDAKGEAIPTMAGVFAAMAAKK